MKHALRRLVSSPVFSVTALVTLGVAIGANALIFSVVNGVLLKPLPFASPDQLVGVWHFAPGIMTGDLNQSPATYLTYREAEVFQDIGMWRDEARLGHRPRRAGARGHAPRHRRHAAAARRQPGARTDLHAGGRCARQPADGDPEPRLLAARVRRRPNAIGQSLVIDGTPTQVIGVLPAGFRFLRVRTRRWSLPFRLNRAELFVGNFSYQALARLKPGTTMQQASADIARLIPGIPDHFPMPPGFSRQMYDEVRLAPEPPAAGAATSSATSARILWVLLGAVGIVLLVACANIANLFLVRAEGRQQELAIRIRARRQPSAGDRRAAGRSVHAQLRPRARSAWRSPTAASGCSSRSTPPQLPRLDEIALDPIVVLFALGGCRSARRCSSASSRSRSTPTLKWHDAQGGRPRIERRPRAASRAARAGRGAGGAGAGAAGRLRADDSHLPRHAQRAARLHGAGTRSSRCASPFPRRS